MPTTIQCKTYSLLVWCLKTQTSIFLVVLNRCETWSLALREEHGLRVFENRMLWRIFGPKRDEIIGGWSKLHNEELYNLHFRQI
jgi:hypothetical protein